MLAEQRLFPGHAIVGLSVEKPTFNGRPVFLAVEVAVVILVPALEMVGFQIVDHAKSAGSEIGR